MRLYNYLNEGRVDHIEEQELKRLIVNNCSQAVDKTFIWRQSDSFRKSLDLLQGGFKGDSSGFTRRSANTANFYTLIIDNTKRWKDYPKRSKSFICASSAMRKEMALTIPFDNTSIGVCPEKDIWLSFGHSLGGMSLDIFNDHLEQVFENYFIEYDKKKLNTDFKYFKDKLNELGSSLGENDVIMNNPFMKKILQNYVDEFYPRGTTFTEYIGYLLDPERNEFSLIETGGKLPEKREVWFSGNAVFITQDKYNVIMQDYSSIWEWANS